MNKKTIVAVILLVLSLGAVLYAINSVRFQDWLRALGYNPTTAVAHIRDDLELTDEAKIIFNATRPSLESRERFNSFCNSHDANVSMLGCYGGGKIYVYDIQNSELSGITESTMAHELLHAAWDRMNREEREELSNDLWQVYDEHQDLFATALDIYDESDKLEELHSRIGTQVAQLPTNLEKHYAKYFKDQDMVVDFYKSYSRTFIELSAQLEDLSNEMKALSDDINSLTEEYKGKISDFSARVERFNDCSNTAGCFASESDFRNQRYELLAEQDALNDLYKRIDQKITEYNVLVEEYNNNVLRTQDLQDSINSNNVPDLVQKG